jgi:hypothetical protein
LILSVALPVNAEIPEFVLWELVLMAAILLMAAFATMVLAFVSLELVSTSPQPLPQPQPQPQQQPQPQCRRAKQPFCQVV